MQRILIVEDDRALNNGIRLALEREGVSIDAVSCLKDAKERVGKVSYDLVILDINLPDGSGLDFLVGLRTKYSIPVILLTARDMETDIVSGLSMGADDYITKPFSLAVLRARVEVQLRKKDRVKSNGYRDSCYLFNFETMEFFYKDIPVELSKTEQKLLKILSENAGMVIKRESLIDRVWSDGGEFVDANALSVSIKRLRDKLKAGDRIKTVYGIGYSWVEDEK